MKRVLVTWLVAVGLITAGAIQTEIHNLQKRQLQVKANQQVLVETDSTR
jgi:hypothetical protein